MVRSRRVAGVVRWSSQFAAFWRLFCGRLEVIGREIGRASCRESVWGEIRSGDRVVHVDARGSSGVSGIYARNVSRRCANSPGMRASRDDFVFELMTAYGLAKCLEFSRVLFRSEVRSVDGSVEESCGCRPVVVPIRGVLAAILREARGDREGDRKSVV